MWAGAAELIETVAHVRGRHDFVTHRLIDVNGVSAALARLYENPDWLRQRSLDAFRQATHSDFSWDRIAAQWDRLFQRLIFEKRDRKPG